MSIIIESLSYIYNPGTPFEKKALDDINLKIETGQFIGLIGHTGSGKSTLIQHLNGLIKSTSGKITIDDIDITKKETNLRAIRQKVGLVFQYPEYQLFEETVFKDVAFGPKNLGIDDTEIEARVKESLELVGLDYEHVKERSPFDLSGGQRRRVAIAGVLAMKPQILVLDEPTAGLDPGGRDEILNQIKSLHQKYNITVVLVSHSMEDVAKYVDKLIVMNKGKVILYGSPREVFRESELLERIGLAAPKITYLMAKLKQRGLGVRDDIFTVEEARDELLRLLRSKEK